jgi:hypothetical protein
VYFTKWRSDTSQRIVAVERRVCHTMAAGHGR